MKGIGKIKSSMAKGGIFLKTVIITMESLMRAKWKVLVNARFFLKIAFMRVIDFKTNNMEKALKYGMMALHIMETIIKVSNTDKGFLNG